ncbi:MAG TPA: flagellar filament capping protein FliD [Kofleriaceae bacterium]|nr:flagellar filament capping protein FliD [Kofleriaceae bacterium]
MAITFSGLASGLDTASLIKQLVAAERSPADAITQKQSDLNTQKSIVASLSSAVSKLGTVVKGMAIPSDLQPRTASASDAHVSVTATAGAASTVHDVRVEQLARGQITASSAFASMAAGVVGAGTLTIATGGKTASVSYSPSDTLSDIAAKINNANVGASASVLYDGSTYRLMVAATGTGSANAPVFTETGASLGLAQPENVKVAAQDAKVSIDGVSVTRSTNTIDDAIQGLTLTLNSPQATGDADTAVTVGLDNSALTTKLSSFVSAYNAINSALHVQLDYTGSTKGTNTLFGDSTLVRLQNSLGGLMSAAYGGNAIDSVGLVRDKDGNLTLDSDKLAAALNKNPNALSDFFVTNGFTKAVRGLTDAYTAAGSGFFATKTQSITDRFKALQTQADNINSRADTLQTTLQSQFNALETAMSNLKSQSSYLTSILG